MGLDQSKPPQIPVAVQGNFLCSTHQSEVLYTCKTCDGVLVCKECATDTHQGHYLESLAAVSSKMKKNIEEYIIQKETHELPNILNEIEWTEKKITENSHHFEKVVEEIETKGKRLKEVVDRVTGELTKTCQLVEESNFKLLRFYKQKLQFNLNELKDRVKRCKHTLALNNDAKIIALVTQGPKDLESLSPPEMKMLNFTENQFSKEYVQNGIGSLSQQGEALGSPLTMAQTAALAHDQCLPVEALRANTPEHEKVSDTLLQEPKVLHEFETSRRIFSIEKSIASDSMWVSHYSNTCLSLINQQGQITQNIEMANGINDISMSRVTGNLWLCCENDNNIYEITPTKRFTPGYVPWCICVTSDNSIVVGGSKKLNTYSVTGDLLHKSQNIVVPYHISNCPKTGNIAVIDRSLKKYDGDGKPNIAVFSPTLHLLFKYKGSSSTSNFNPNDLLYTSRGALLIADYSSKCIQLIRGDDAQFLAVIYRDNTGPRAMTMTQNDQLWVCFMDKSAKIISLALYFEQHNHFGCIE